MATYQQLMTAIIKRQIGIIGAETALKKARTIKGVKVDDSGNLIFGASKENLEALVNVYKSIAGGVAVMLMKKAIEPILNGKEDLPGVLR